MVQVYLISIKTLILEIAIVTADLFPVNIEGTLTINATVIALPVLLNMRLKTQIVILKEEL